MLLFVHKKKFFHSANLLIALLLLATPSAAQTPPPPKLAHIVKKQAEGLLGQPVVDGKGNVIGTVVNVLINAQGAPDAAVVEFAGFLGLGNRDVAVAWKALHFSLSGNAIVITVTLDADKLKALQVYTPDASSVPVAVPSPPAPSKPAKKPG